MSRKPRIHKPAGFYHVMLRGNNGQDIFFTESDRYRFCLFLQEGTLRFGHYIHAFCLMTNHVHLVIQPGITPLSQIVKRLASCYAMYINRVHARIGHLFQGRFKAILVDDSKYLAELIRYIHLNPVRAGMVKAPEGYLWSSHQTYLGLNHIPWLTQETLMKKFDNSATHSARKCYLAFINEGIGLPIPKEVYLGFYRGAIVGDNKFSDEIAKAVRLSEKQNSQLTTIDILNQVASLLEISVAAMQSRAKQSRLAQGRGIAALITKEHPGLTIQALANELNKDPDALSKSAIAVETMAIQDEKLKEAIDKIRQQLAKVSQD